MSCYYGNDINTNLPTPIRSQDSTALWYEAALDIVSESLFLFYVQDPLQFGKITEVHVQSELTR